MRFSSLFGFTTGPVTTVVTVTYLAIFAATVVIHEYGWPAPPPDEQLGLDLEVAMKDLRVIARQAHPFNSPRNDVVHDYILSRVQAAADKYPEYVQVEDDLLSNITVARSQYIPHAAGVYFEGNNVLVKIDGERPGLPAVLLSAHFDSVSTAPGATDDGMGVSTLLQLVDYFSAHRPSRTLVFNINNAEEDGLFGAQAFIPHPWSSLPHDFLNLEGAGQGGRPFLLRTSAPHVARAFAHVPHPHGNALTQDALQKGVVRSGTDYTVYEEAGMEGLDVAFYRGRSRYHTKADDVPGLGGAQALWAMMETSFFVTKGLMEDFEAPGSKEVIFFDVLGSAMGITTLTVFFAINIVMLVVGPLVVLLLLWYTHIRHKASFPLHGLIRFPIAFILSVGLTVGLGVLYNFVNPYIVHSSSYLVLISLISTAYVTLFFTLTIFSSVRPVHQQKVIVLLQSYILWWFLLAISTGFEGAPNHLISPYFVTFFHAGVLAALLIGLVEGAFLEWRGHKVQVHTTHVVHQEENGAREEPYDEGTYEAVTERTPLVAQPAPEEGSKGEQRIPGLWLFEFWIGVVFPAIWATQTALVMMTALGQSLVDGSAPLTVYLGLAIVAVLIVLPLAPFMHALSSSISVVLLLALGASIVWNLFAKPFTPSYPFKVFFHQEIMLDADPPRNEVMLAGVKGVIPEVAQSWHRAGEVQCGMDKDIVVAKRGLEVCSWEGEAGAEGMGVDYSVTRTGRSSAALTLTGSATRVCGVEFDKPVQDLRISGAAPPKSPLDDLSSIVLFSRTWNRTFELEFSFSDELTGGSVYCEWADARPGRIVELDDVLASVPVWVAVTKATSGLVVGRKSWTLPGLEELD